MAILSRLQRLLVRALEIWLVLLIVAMTLVVVLAVVWRTAGSSFVWYDEVAAIMLAWIAYYGAALAAFRRSHIGVDDILLALPIRWRMICVAVSEMLILIFFAVLAWAGWEVLGILHGASLVSLPSVPLTFVQSVVPIGAVLFMICEALSLPEYLRRVREGVSSNEVELAEHLEGQEVKLT